MSTSTTTTTTVKIWFADSAKSLSEALAFLPKADVNKEGELVLPQDSLGQVHLLLPLRERGTGYNDFQVTGMIGLTDKDGNDIIRMHLKLNAFSFVNCTERVSDEMKREIVAGLFQNYYKDEPVGIINLQAQFKPETLLNMISAEDLEEYLSWPRKEGKETFDITETLQEGRKRFVTLVDDKDNEFLAKYPAIDPRPAIDGVGGRGSIEVTVKPHSSKEGEFVRFIRPSNTAVITAVHKEEGQFFYSTEDDEQRLIAEAQSKTTAPAPVAAPAVEAAAPAVQEVSVRRRVTIR